MPPNGYDTVTLPEDLVQRIDELAEDFHVDSRVAVLRSLIAEHKENDDAESDIDYAEIERRCKRAVRSDLEDRR